VVPRWVGAGTWDVSDASPKGGAESEDGGGEEEDGNFSSEAALAEFVDVLGFLGEDDAEEDEWDGEEGGYCEVGCSNELHIAIDSSGVV